MPVPSLWPHGQGIELTTKHLLMPKRRLHPGQGLRPARLLGVEAQRGTLRPGARADLVVLDAGLRVQETWVGGEVAYRAPA